MTRAARSSLSISLLVIGWALSLQASAQAQAPAQTQASTPEYKVQAGDTIDVSVWKEEDLKLTAVIRPDGKFSFPLAGEVQASGRTATEIRSDIENRLKVYISDPVVTVSVPIVDGNRIYVIGQVTKPGMFVMNPRVNVVQALSLSGGTTPFAKLDDILVIRTVNGVQRAIPFRYSLVTSGKDLSQNIMLESGDVVLVP
jgi:polysaccharide export outer membrane protein